MKIFVLFLLLVVVGSMVNTALGSENNVGLTEEEKADLKGIIESTNKFAINLSKELLKAESGNVIVSPLSAQMVLALAYTGAGGATASELKSLLSLPDSLNQTLSGYHSLINSLQDPVLKLANRMFVEKTAGVKQSFQNNAQKYFLAPAEPVGFQTDPEQSREQINLWVENQTNKKITNLFEPGALDQDTRLVLVNAIHFKANWEFQFDKNNTREEPFHVSKTETKPVQMMYVMKKFGYSNSFELKSKILELKYEQKNFRMIIILPDKIDGLAELEAKLDTFDLFNELKSLHEYKVAVLLPKFKLEQSIDFKDILMSMGVKTMFTGSADFSKLSEEPLYVSKVIQKAFVEVNEEGTEAAAATGAAIETRSFPGQFIVDHPFLFLIVTDNFPIFIGRVVTPE